MEQKIVKLPQIGVMLLPPLGFNIRDNKFPENNPTHLNSYPNTTHTTATPPKELYITNDI